MIDDSETIYYALYALLVASTGVIYLKLRSTEGQVITTKEFQLFQSGFLTGYSLTIVSELIAAASFFHTFVSLKLTLQQITKLYITTVLSTTCTGVLIDVVDLGTRKDKCSLSAGLYSISMFSIFFGGHHHMEYLLLGRIVYGVAAGLQHSSFESYAINGHTSLGFPDDWLGQTFSYLTHAMTLMAALSGLFGQVAESIGGEMGCVALCCGLFALAAVYIALMWEKDTNVPRFMLNGYIQNFSRTLSSLRSNKQTLMLLVVTSLCETSITIFTFYWAPWMLELTASIDIHIPYEIIFSSYIVANMLGNYLYQIYTTSPGSSVGQIFQAILVSSSVSYFLGAVFQVPSFAFFVSIAIQIAMGGYFPCIGYFRGRLIMPEFRSACLTISRIATLIMTSIILFTIHHSPSLILSVCAILNGIAAYLQIMYMETKNFTDDASDSSDEESY